MIVAGCGYTGRRLAARHNDALALVSSAESRAKLAALGIAAAVWNLDSGDPPPALTTPTDVVYLVPPPPAGRDDPRLARFLARLPWPPTRFVYASTTGVYGNRDGARVDESTPPAPISARARRRVAAETATIRWCEQHDVPWVILRIPGIYGPDRLQLDTLDAGRPVLRPDLAGPGNRIHVDDLVRCLDAALVTSADRRVFNVGDGDHASNSEFVAEVARQLHRPPPPFETLEALRATVSERRWSFMRESREVDTRAMRRELGVAPGYPGMRDGIAASLAAMGLVAG